ncbi:MAG: PqqD family peptide modification chaperone [Candidatus Thermoplasmatota archaeon]|nr:PqqD family peptide modification chaperone [Candidatus Thermoplasmatota archaeon]
MRYLLLKPDMELIKTTRGGLLFDRMRGKHIMLTPTEGLILSLCDGSRTFEDITKYIAKTYGLDKVKCEYDVKNFILSIQKEVLVQLDRPIEVQTKTVSPDSFKEIGYSEVLIPEKIMTLGISPTYDCSLKCEYCFARAGENDTHLKMLNLETVKRVLNEGAELGAIRLDVSGGDPINYRYMPEMVKEAVELGYRDITISTKGVAVTADIARRLRLAGLNKIQLSIDTLNPELYDSIVGRDGMYQRMIRGWYNLKKEGFTMVNRATVTRRTINHVVDMLKKTYDMGIYSARLIGVQEYGRGKNSMMAPIEDMVKLREDVEILSESYPNSRWIVGDLGFGEPYPCEGGISRIWVHPDGRVSLCDVAGTYLDSSPIFVFGNIKNEKLSEIWKNKIPSLFRTVRDSKCLNCSIANECRGGCPLFASTYYGDVMKAIPTCKPLKEGGIIWRKATL